MSVVTEAQMVPTVPDDSKLYSFYGHFMMPAARLTAGMLTVLSVASPFRAQGQEHNTPPHSSHPTRSAETLVLRPRPGRIAVVNH